MPFLRKLLPPQTAAAALGHGTATAALQKVAATITCNSVYPRDVSTRIFYRNAKPLAERKQITRAEAQQRVAAANTSSGGVVAPEQVAAPMSVLCGGAVGEIRGAPLPAEGAWLAR